MNAESSTISKFTTESQRTESFHLFSQNDASVAEMSYPLFDIASRKVILPGFFYLFSYLYLCIQILCTSLWTIRNSLINTTNFNFVRQIEKIAYLISYEYYRKNQLIIFLIVTALQTTILSLIIFQIVYYHNVRKLIIWTLYPTRFLIEIIPLIFSHFLANLAGHSYLRIISKDFESIENLYFLTYCFFFVLNAMLFRLTGNVILSSAYLDDHCLCSYDFSHFYFLVVVNSMFHFGSRIFSTYNTWIDYVLLLFHIFFIFYFSFHVFHMFFVKNYSTIILGTTLLSAIFFDVSKIFSDFMNLKIDNLLYFLIPAEIIISVIILSLYVKKIVKKYNQLLSYNKEKNFVEMERSNQNIVQISEEEKTERLKILLENASESTSKLLLHIGFTCGCDIFIDFSLIHYVSQNITSKGLLLMCIRILAYFPTESRLLNSLINSAMRRRDLNESDQFLLYQLKKIKILRQASSSSAAAIDRLMKMKNASKQCELEMKSFWNNSITNITDLRAFFKTISKNEALWEETLADYPNSISHYEEYIKFLIECSTNFEKAVMMKHKVSLIEMGTNFSTDFCYRSMIKSNPIYLKKKILDLKGNVVMNKNTSDGSHNSSNNHYSSSGGSSDSFDIDLRLQEKIGNELIHGSKIRIALQHATMGFKATNSNLLFSTNVLTFIIYLIMVSICYFYYKSIFSDRYFATERSSYTRTVKTGFSIATVFNLLDWANRTTPKRVSFEESLSYFDSVDTSSQTFYDHHLDYPSSMYHFQKLSLYYYVELLKSISELAMKNVNVYELTKVLLSKSVPLTFCYYGNASKPEIVDLKSALSYQYYSQLQLILNSDPENWWHNNSHSCSLFLTFSNISSSVFDLRESFNADQLKSSKEIGSEIKIILYFVTPICFLLFFVPISFVTYNYLEELKKVLSMLFSIDTEFKKAAASSLMKGTEEKDEENIQHDDLGVSTFSGRFYFVSFLVLFLGNASLFALIIYKSMSLNTQFFITSQWSYMASIRSSLVADCLVHIFQAIFLQDESISSRVTFSSLEAISFVQKYVEQIQLMKENLLMGVDSIPPLIGVDDILDRLAIKEQCIPPLIGADLHDMYKCSSSNQLLSIFRDMMMEIESHIFLFNASLNDFSISNFFHLSMNHLLPMLIEMDERIDKLMVLYITQFENDILLLYITAIVLSFLVFLVIRGFNQTFDDAHGASMTLLRHIPPLGIITNIELVDYLISRKSEKKSEETTSSSSVVQGSNNGIVGINISGTIEFLNPAITHILGDTPEQLLGQSIQTIFSENDGKDIVSKMNLMINKQYSNTYECHCKCINDNEMTIDCAVTLHGLLSKSKENIESFIVIIRDESELSHKQKEAEEAKQQSETLLLQILPRDIILRLNRGEKDITFVVPLASIMFIDIVKFGEYSSNLSPDEILSNLSFVFSTFDDLLSKYPLITKIKLIGDIYMCAAGLFSMDSNSNHAEQMIRFGLEALQHLEDINVKLNSNLSIRIGVNSGGPIIAGVLGTDKPVFDIIGDTINVSSRLTSTCVPGHIQISQSTYDLVNNLDFNIDPRGEVFLKGKGKTPTYLVRQNNFLMNISSMGSIIEEKK